MANLIGFSGVPTGSQFEITAGDRTRGTGAGGWGVAQAQGAPRVTIRLKRSFLQVAPEGMNFEAEVEGFETPGPTAATGSYDPRFHEIYYVWNFGDPGKTFTKPEHILPEHRDANRAYGPVASHTYTAPGTYTVTLDVIEPASGKTAQATLDVTVNDPDGLFAGDKTIFVDPDGDFTNAPVGAITETDIITAINNNALGAQPNYKRFMLNRGKVHLWRTPVYPNDLWPNFYFCAGPGGGDVPVVLVDSDLSDWAIIMDRLQGNGLNRPADLVLTDLKFIGYWDGVNEGAKSEVVVGGTTYPCQHPETVPIGLVYGDTKRRGTYQLLNNIEANGFFTHYFAGNANDPGTYTNIINDCFFTNWQNFGIYADHPDSFAVVGSRVTHQPTVAAGGRKVSDQRPYWNNWHGPVRLQQCRETVLDACDFYAGAGWFENYLGMHTGQPAVRLAEGPSPDGKINVQRSHFESNGECIKVIGLGTGQQYALNVLIERNYVIGGYCQTESIAIRKTGVTVRNNVVIGGTIDRSALYGALVYFGPIALRGSNNPAPGWEDGPVKIYNNTFVMRNTTAETGFDTVPVYIQPGAVPYNDVTIENNLNYFPNTATGVDGAIEMTTLFTPRYDGYRSYKHIVSGTLAADVNPGESFTIPYAAFGGGVTGASDFDFTNPNNEENKRRGLIIAGVSVTSAQGEYGMDLTDFTMSTDGTGVVVTSTDTEVWPSGAAWRAATIRSGIYFRPEYATPTDTIVSATLPPGSSALGAATSGPVAYDDMRGNPRPALPALGAYELE